MTLCMLLHFFLLQGRLALKKTARLAGILDLLQGHAAHNAAAARSHARRRLVEQPP